MDFTSGETLPDTADLIEALQAQLEVEREDKGRWMRRALQMAIQLERQHPTMPPVVVIRGKPSPAEMAEFHRAWRGVVTNIQTDARWVVLPEAMGVLSPEELEELKTAGVRMPAVELAAPHGWATGENVR